MKGKESARKTGGQFLRYAVIALTILGLKLALTHAFLFLVSPLLSYALTQVFVSVASYLGHARFTFHRPLRWHGFLTYLRVLVVFQILDYLTFAFFLTALGIRTTGSILVATGVIFLLRFIFVRRNFKSQSDLPHHADSSP